MRSAARRLELALRPGETALVTGPSGSGKSTLLRELARRLRKKNACPVVVGAGACAEHAGRSVLDVLAVECGSAEAALGVLARAGLADARLLPRRRGDLSEGQRHRFDLAIAMARLMRRGGPGRVLIIDEFASMLDRASARGVAGTVSRWARRSGARVVCATAHDDVLEMLGPRVLVVVGDGGRAEVFRRE
ncbi:MAG: AAA family ATPase [Phycisphaerales bacterium]|nr:AAA family ATPase [Phycisphaerales bacterium]